MYGSTHAHRRLISYGHCHPHPLHRLELKRKPILKSDPCASCLLVCCVLVMMQKLVLKERNSRQPQPKTGFFQTLILLLYALDGYSVHGGMLWLLVYLSVGAHKQFGACVCTHKKTGKRLPNKVTTFWKNDREHCADSLV